jgi:hypothetical protein
MTTPSTNTPANQEYEDAGDLAGRTLILYRLAHCDELRSNLAKAQQSLQTTRPDL